ncbi:MAG: hypothetical protein V3R99_04635 [Thermoguttaceae bacterium]
MLKTLFALLCTVVAIPAAAEETIALQNAHIRIEFSSGAGACKTTRLVRSDGTDALDLHSDQFEILLFDDSRFTVDDYQLDGPVNRSLVDGKQTLRLDYIRKAPTNSEAPSAVTVEFALGDGPYVHKTVRLKMRQGARIDRLQVLRFSTSSRASRGGFGQPVFVGNWFFGVDYPGFYSRHSDGFVEPDFYYRWNYNIELDDRDREFAPRAGLVSLFHFPGDAREQTNGEWGIVGKRAVMGISRQPGDTAELGLFDYIAETRKPPRSYLHYNNWYSPEGKILSVENFIDRVYRPIKENLAPYGAVLDGMVPDHGWENSKSFKRIFEPKADPRYDLLTKISQALIDDGPTRLGAWIALDGTNQSISHGLAIGYKPAYVEGFDRAERWMQGKAYFDILDPRYVADLKESLRYLLVDAKVNYIKHDFNHNFTSAGLTQRHARERCLDTTLELLAYQRSLNPAIYQNYTNGSWFSPWWLQHVDTLWMMSGDSGGGGEWPQLSLRDGATTYRDRYFFQSFNNPERCPRPVIPIANFMTHGILFSRSKPFTDFNDTLHDWANYVMMYFARGTLLKELYITPELLDDDHWRVLGMAANWAVHNQDRLVNTVQVGGDAAKGAVYGYVSWVDDRAILTVRNPDRREQTLTVPFDSTVYYRGKRGRSYHARAIYPFVEEMPWRLVSGREMSIDVPGDSVLVYEIEPGTPTCDRVIRPAALPPFQSWTGGGTFELTLHIPDEHLPRWDLLIEPWALVDLRMTINGKTVVPHRSAEGKRWRLYAFDLREYRGQTLSVRGKILASAASEGTVRANLEAWLVGDRQVATPTLRGENLPPAAAQHARRLTQRLIDRATVVRVITGP